jgi:hypothetical protein
VKSHKQHARHITPGSSASSHDTARGWQGSSCGGAAGVAGQQLWQGSGGAHLVGHASALGDQADRAGPVQLASRDVVDGAGSVANLERPSLRFKVGSAAHTSDSPGVWPGQHSMHAAYTPGHCNSVTLAMCNAPRGPQEAGCSMSSALRGSMGVVDRWQFCQTTKWHCSVCPDAVHQGKAGGGFNRP